MDNDSGLQSGTTPIPAGPDTHSGCKKCPPPTGSMMNRRSFLTTTAAAALAAQTDVLNLASSLFAAEAASGAKPTVSVLFSQRKTGGGLTYPTATTKQLQEIKELFVKTLKDAAKRFGVELDVQAEPVKDANASLARIKKTAPDGLIIIDNELWQRKLISQLVQKRGNVPTILYSNVSHFIRWAETWWEDDGE